MGAGGGAVSPISIFSLFELTSELQQELAHHLKIGTGLWAGPLQRAGQ